MLASRSGRPRGHTGRGAPSRSARPSTTRFRGEASKAEHLGGRAVWIGRPPLKYGLLALGQVFFYGWVENHPLISFFAVAMAELMAV